MPVIADSVLHPYAHSIAIARTLLEEGRWQDARRMLEPLAEARAETASGPDHASAVLRATLAHAVLLEEEEPDAALSLLQEYRSAVVRRQLTPLARAWVALSLGLGLGHARRETEGAVLALGLLHEAADLFRKAGDPSGLCWTLIGEADVLRALGEVRLSRVSRTEAARLCRRLHDRSAESWLGRLDRGGTRYSETTAAGLQARDKGSEPGLVYSGPAMKDLVQRARGLAHSSVPLLIEGEPGTGKSLLASVIHAASPRAAEPFQVVDCAQLAPDDVVRRLFGESGGASPGPRGILSSAACGTLLLKEPARMPHAIQERLTRFIRRESQTTDSGPRLSGGIRFVTTSSVPMIRLLDERAVRQDLLYSLGVRRLTVPALRDRREDVVLLARHFADSYSRFEEPPVSFTDRALQALVNYDWPGNVLELKSEIGRVLEGLDREPVPVIDVGSLSERIVRATDGDKDLQKWASRQSAYRGRRLDEILAATERAVIERVLTDNGGRIAVSAEVLGLTRQGLYKKMKRLGIEAGENTPRRSSRAALRSRTDLLTA